MKLKNLLKIFLATVLTISSLQAQTFYRCLQEFEIRVLNGSDEVYSCVGDQLEDVLQLRSSSYATPIGYLVVDAEDIIVKYSLRSFLRVDDLPVGNYRIYGFSFLGTPSLKRGMKLGETQLANICYELSDNFIRLFNVDPDGQAVSTADGKSSLYVCSQDGNPDVVTFQTTSRDPNYGYLITDENDIIEAVVDGNNFDFEGQPLGISRVWGVSYVGEFSAVVGESIFTTQLASACADLSDNFIEIIKTEPEGGQVQLTTGETNTVVCTGDAEEDILTFSVSGNAMAPYQFILTDSANNILLVLNGNAMNFDFLATGFCRMWGVSFTGNLTATVGANILTDQLSDDCFDLSDNFIEIIKKNPSGGQVAFSDGTTEALICVNDLIADPVVLTNNGGLNESYIYILTDTSGQIVQTFEGDNADLEGLPGGRYRIYGLAFSGLYQGMAGDDIFSTTLSDECFELSQNFISLDNVILEPGSISLPGGSQDTLLCFGDPQADQLSFVVNGQNEMDAYRYLITDENNTIIAILDTPFYDFSNITIEECRVWGLSYTGQLLAQLGDQADAAVLSTECYRLTDDFIHIRHLFVEGGTISLTDGSDSAVLCVQDGFEDLIAFQALNALERNYAYIFTDTSGNIVRVIEENNYDFENDDAGELVIYGLSFVGELLAEPGQQIQEAQLASECYDLSGNTVRIDLKLLEAGAISLASGTQDTILCFGDPQADQLSFLPSGFNGIGEYRFVLTDRQNVVLDIFDTSNYDFIDITVASCKVFGISFTGALTLEAGDVLTSSVLSDECYDITDDFVSITHLFVEGGVIRLTENSADTVVCSSDGIPDIVSFETNSTADANYRFLLTDENDNILIALEGNSINLDIANAGICRIYGISYTDELTADVGMNINDPELAANCFDLSDNYIELVKKDLIAGQIRLENGATSTEICAGNNYRESLSFTNDSPQDDAYIYLVTDENNTILEISSSPTIIFDDVDIPVCRIYGAIFTGDQLVQAGDNILTTAISTECFEVTGNFVTVRHKIVEGGNVSLSDGRLFTNICVRDGNPDLIELTTDSEADENYAYLLTNDRNQLLTVLNSNSVDLDGSVGGVVKIFGFSYTGNIIVGFNQDVTTAVLSDDCYDLSDNAVTVNRIDLEAGEVSLINGLGRLEVCFGDAGQDRIRMRNTSPAGTRYAYVLTDEQGEILQFSTSPSILLEYRPVERVRIYGLAYTGNPLTNAQGSIFEALLSTECYELSTNFVEISYTLVDGGQLSTTDGRTEIEICVNDGQADVVELQAATQATGQYSYILTDGQDNIITRLLGNSVNLEVIAPGICKVWGVSHQEEIEINVGANILTADLADECFDLSDNAVIIRKDEVIGGMVNFSDGSTQQFSCPDNPSPKLLTFVNTGSTTGDYAYLITNTNDELLAIAGEEGFDFDNIPDSIARVWGVAYVDSLVITEGETVTTATLADRCAMLSDNFIEVFKITPEAGSIVSASGQDNFDFCNADGLPDLIRLDSIGAFEGAYAYLLTDEEGQFIQQLVGDQIDFDTLPSGEYQIYGLAYTGNIIAIEGSIVTEENLTDDCFDVSENAINIINDQPNAGRIETGDKETLVYVCPEDNEPNLLRFFVDDLSLNAFVYLLTDENNNVLQVLEENEFDFENEAPLRTRVWALSYTGEFLAGPGVNLDTDVLSSGCADLSDNAITVVRDAPDGGQLSTAAGSTSFRLCVNDGNPDSIVFLSTEQSASPYLLFLTDENNLIQDTTSSLEIDFENSNPGISRVWRLSYTGRLQFNLGEDIQRTILADDCFELSENFIEVTKTQVDGGIVSTIFGSDSIYVCPDDMQDIITFTNNSMALGGDYAYALTRANGLILGYLDASNSRDFNNTAIRELRIYGISYTGNFINHAGTGRIDLVMHSDSCYTLSDNFITVFLDVPDGGTISTADGAGSVQFCSSPSNSSLELAVDNNSRAGYVYLLTQEDGEIVALSNGNSIDMTNIPRGNYLVYGLSYTGMLNIGVGDNVNDGDLATSCFDLAVNTIEVERAGEVDGGELVLSDGSTTLYSCPGDALPDLAVVFSSSTLQDENYRYLITDANNRIVIPNAGGSLIDFNGAPAGVYRIWALSYTGDLSITVNRDLTTMVLSDECYELSSNYITVFNEGVTGGMVSTLDSATEVSLSVDEAVANGLDVQQEGSVSREYAFILTDENNAIIDATFETNVDLAMLDTGSYRIYGLALNGNYIGMTGSDINFSQLSDDCFALSDNFIALNIVDASAELAEEEKEEIELILPEAKEAELSVWPNPAYDRLGYELEAPALGQAQIVVFNAFGQQVMERSIQLDQLKVRSELDVSQLQNGIYLMVIIQNGKVITKERFVKTR